MWSLFLEGWRRGHDAVSLGNPPRGARFRPGHREPSGPPSRLPRQGERNKERNKLAWALVRIARRKGGRHEVLDSRTNENNKPRRRAAAQPVGAQPCLAGGPERAGAGVAEAVRASSPPRRCPDEMELLMAGWVAVQGPPAGGHRDDSRGRQKEGPRLINNVKALRPSIWPTGRPRPECCWPLDPLALRGPSRP